MKNLFDITKNMKTVEFTKNERLIDEIKILLEANKQSFIDILSKDNTDFGANYKYENLLEIVNKVVDYPYDNIKKYTSIGTVVGITNGDVYFAMELILKSLITKTKFVLMTDQYMLSTNTYLVDLVKKVLESNKISTNIVNIYSMLSYKDTIKAVDNIDCIVVNKDYETYKNIEELTNIKVVYSDYGNINIYSESEDFTDNIKMIYEDAKRENRDIFLTKTDDIKKYLIEANNNFVFYSVVVYTKNLDKCTYFINNIKAENVYINENPFDYVDVNFSEFEFLYHKNIVY